MGVKRVYVEKKPEFAVQAKELRHEVKSYLGIKTVKNVRVLIRYDVENLSDATFERACNGVFAEPPVDVLYREDFPREESDHIFSVEFLPGQFDQRADSAVQCVQFIKEDELPVIKTATTYVIEGEISEEEMEAIKAHCINPVDSRETGLEKPETLVTKFEEPADVKIFDGFKDMPEAELKELYSSLGLAMTFKDFQHIQNYFKGEEHRDPSMTEIRVLDTYWSDHCRHTTFSTELTEVSFGDGDYRKPMEDTYKEYLQTHSEIFKGREDKFVCLMDLALMAMRKLKKEGKRITQNDLQFFQQRVGSDMENISRELEKLFCYTMGRDVITAADIEAVCTRQIGNQIFDMVEAIAMRRQKQALDLYYDLLTLKEPPMRILFLIARQFNLLLQVKELVKKGYGNKAIGEKIGLPGFIAGKYVTQASHFSKSISIRFAKPGTSIRIASIYQAFISFRSTIKYISCYRVPVSLFQKIRTGRECQYSDKE